MQYRWTRSIALLVIGAGFLFARPQPSRAGDWPGWRGPTGLGYSDEKDLPLTWDGKTGKNILWKVALLRTVRGVEFSSPGHSCPIVWRDRVIVTTAVWPEGLTRDERKLAIPAHHVLCLRAGDGQQMWDTLVPPGPCHVDNGYHGYAVPTPATDGSHIFVLFGSAVIACLDLDGKIVWREELPYQRATYGGICSSLVLHEDTVIAVGIGEAGLCAFDKKMGKVKWEQKLRERTQFTTPTLLRIRDQVQLIHLAGNGVFGVNPASGAVLWSCKAPVSQASPSFGSGLLYVDQGRGKGTGTAIDPTGEGDVTRTHVKWKSTEVPNAAGVSSIIVGDYIYRSGEPGVIKCWKLATGELVYDERLTRVSPSASPVATADGRIYFASAGRSFVIQSGPKLEILATNDLGDNQPYAAAAISGGRIFIKGQSHLWCIGSK